MRKPSAAMILSLMLALSWTSFFASRPRAADERKPSRVKWEYKVETVRTAKDEEAQIAAFQDQLKELGQQGWEFSQIQGSAVVLKRPKQ